MPTLFFYLFNPLDEKKKKCYNKVLKKRRAQDMSEVWNYLLEHSAELLTGAGMILAVLLGKPKTAEKLKAKADRSAARKAAKAQKLLDKAGKLTEELKEEKKE